MKFVNGKTYYSFNLWSDPIKFEIVETKCLDAENLYFENEYSEYGWSDSQYDDLDAAKKFVFLYLISCMKGAVRFVMKDIKWNSKI